MESGRTGPIGTGSEELDPATATPGAIPPSPTAPDGTTTTTPPPPRRGARRTRVSSTWVGIAVAAVLLILLIIFIAENSEDVKISFLGAGGNIPVAVALLIAAVAGIVLTLLVGSARIVQLRRALRRHEHRHR